MARCSSRAAVVAALLLAPPAVAQEAPMFPGSFIEPETGAVIAFAACPAAPGLSATGACGTVAGWHDDSPVKPDRRSAACSSLVIVETGSPATPGDPRTFKGRGVLAGLGTVLAGPGPLGSLQVTPGRADPRAMMERRVLTPMSVTWFPARWGWTACGPAPTS